MDPTGHESNTISVIKTDCLEYVITPLPLHAIFVCEVKEKLELSIVTAWLSETNAPWRYRGRRWRGRGRTPPGRRGRRLPRSECATTTRGRTKRKYIYFYAPMNGDVRHIHVPTHQSTTGIPYTAHLLSRENVVPCLVSTSPADQSIPHTEAYRTELRKRRGETSLMYIHTFHIIHNKHTWFCMFTIVLGIINFSFFDLVQNVSTAVYVPDLWIFVPGGLWLL